MEISNLYDDLSITDVQEKAAPVGDSLRVAVTKTSAQGKAAQSATPNLMSFSSDENSIWFNGKKYGVYILKGFENLSTDSNTGVIQSFLGDFTYDRWVDAVNTGNIVFVETNNILIPASVYANNSEDLNIMFVTLTYTYFVSIHYSTGSGYSINLIQQDSLVRVADVNNTLTNSSTDKPLSAAMGKKLNDEKLAKTDVVNSLSDSSTNKALSAAQGKALNDKLSSNKISINFSAINNTSDSATIKGYMGNLDGTALVTKLTYGATLIDSSSEDWVITPQEVSASKVVFVGLKLQSFRIFTKTITVTISGSNYTNMAVITADRYVPNVVNNLTSSDTANALSAAQGKALNDKISALGSVYRIKGSKTNISEVLALTDAKVGDAWNVTNAFTFGGKPYPANTNVVCLVATSTSDHDENNWDPIGGTVDLSPYAKKTEVEEADNEIWEQLNVAVSKDEIVNNLTSTNIDKPLSAAMGKRLQDEKLSKTDANTTYIPKSSIVDNLETSDSNKVLSAKQGLALRTLIEGAQNTVGVYRLLNIVEEGTLATAEEVNRVLGTYSTFSNEVNKPSVVIGRVRDSSQTMYVTALSVRTNTTASTIFMYSKLPSNKEVHIKATYSGSNWTSCVTEFVDSVTGVIIE